MYDISIPANTLFNANYTTNQRKKQVEIFIAGWLNINGAIYSPDNDSSITGKENPPLHERCRCKLIALNAIIAGTATTAKQLGADYTLFYLKLLPTNYITKANAKYVGWKQSKGNLDKVLPGAQIGGDIFYNYSNKLPAAQGRIWYEADLNYEKGYRNGHRVLYSNDGLVFVSFNHYHSFYEITGGISWQNI
jgi:hypothetical protein